MTSPVMPTPRPMPPGQVQAIRQLLVDEVATQGGPSRSHRMSMPRRRVLPILAVVATATIGVTVGTNVLGTSNAYASWTAVPDQLSGNALAARGAQCQHRLAAHFKGEIADSAPAVAEQRGKFSATLIAIGPRVGICINGIPDGQLGDILELAPVRERGLTLLASPGLVGGPGAIRQAIGQVTDPSVIRVVVTTEDGRHVTASIGDGLYLAWWPSGSNVKDVTGYDRSGAAVATAH